MLKFSEQILWTGIWKIAPAIAQTVYPLFLPPDDCNDYDCSYGHPAEARCHATVTLERPVQFCLLHTHEGSLERILQELLHNACKYTPAGETITLAIERGSERFCCFRVINTGADIPPEEQERVFDNFYRIPTHDPWQYGGTGLGLVLVKKLVEGLGGTIRLTSANKRTEFMVSLPIFCI